MHWADVLAEDLLDRGDEHTLATGITPSGPIHVGNLREVMTTEAVHRALVDAGGDSTLLYVGDTFDPLRKVYPFLEDHLDVDYSEHVGKPLSEVPAPDGEHETYAHQFLTPFLGSLEQLGIEPEVHLAHEMYQTGAYADAIETALEHRDTIADILERESGRDIAEHWVPFNVRCTECGRLDVTEATAWDPPHVAYRCGCGHEGEIDVREPGAGKLPWRVDWPARWSILDVSFEAFGKDHAASGGSWDTGVPIAREVYGIDPPEHTVYEWLGVEGEGAMSSSEGTGIAAEDMLEVTPPEVLRFFFLRYQPSKSIEFDAREGMLELVDTYDRTISEYAETGDSDEITDVERVLELSQPSGEMPEHPGQTVSMRHLARLVDLYEDTDEVLASVRRSGHVDELTDEEASLLRARVDHTRAWLQRFAPEDAQVKLPDEAPPADLWYALDEYRKPMISLSESEPDEIASRAHELSAWLQGAPNVNASAVHPPEEITTYAVWQALAEATETSLELPRPSRLPAAVDELPAAFADVASHQREGKAQALVPIVVHLARRARDGHPADTDALAGTIEDWIEATGAGHPPELPDAETLPVLLAEIDAAIREAETPDVTPSGRFVEQTVRAIGKRLDADALNEAGFSPPELDLRDVLVARQLLQRGRAGLKALGRLFADADWEADELQNAVYETSDQTGIGTGDVFTLAYLTVLGTTRGPRLGPFLAGLDREWVTARFDDLVAVSNDRG